ncbi:MAG: hypothetical protein GC129_01855 [Proteobacteria bacterium]|nr:hypothetical protein [Pseudomonadota bacterium]
MSSDNFAALVLTIIFGVFTIVVGKVAVLQFLNEGITASTGGAVFAVVLAASFTVFIGRFVWDFFREEPAPTHHRRYR